MAVVASNVVYKKIVLLLLMLEKIQQNEHHCEHSSLYFGDAVLAGWIGISKL